MYRGRASRTITVPFAAALITSSLAACAFDGSIEDDPALDEIEGGKAGGREPVIFVHGCPPPPTTNNDESLLMLPMMDFFRARGYPDSHLIRFSHTGPACDSVLTQAAALAAVVSQARAATGSSKVDFVASSMGALTVRQFTKGATGQVDDLITIGGGNHGSLIAVDGVALQAAFGAPAYEGMKQMFVPYACQGQAVQAADVQFGLNGCLTLTGRSVQRDETPGQVTFLSIRNSIDEIVQPGAAACLNQQKQNDCSDTSVNKVVTVAAGLCPDGTPCPGHITQLFDPGVMQMTFDAAND